MSWTLGGTVAGLVIVASATLGAGTAAAEAPDCSRALLPLLPATQRAACELLLGGSSSSSSGSSSTPRSQSSGGPVGRVLQGATDDVSGTVGTVTGRAPATRAPSQSSGSTAQPRSSSGASASAPSTRAAAPAAVAAAPVTAAPVAAAPDAGTLLSSSYARVPASLLGTAAPAGGAGASLIAPTSYDPGLLLSGTPGRTLAPAGAADGVTTTSSAGPVATPVGSRLGTPLLIGVLAASTVIALAVRSSVLRRSRRPAAA